MVLVVVVGAFIGIKVTLQIRLQPGVSGFGPQQVGIVRGVSGSSQTPAHSVSNGGHGGHTGLQPRQQEQTEQRGHDAHGMPPDKAHSGPTRFPGCARRFSCRLCALIDRCLCLLLILPLLPLPTPEPDPDVFTQLRVLLSSPLELVICRRFAVTALRPPYHPRRTGADALLGKPHCLSAHSLAHQLRAVCALDADILMLHLKNLAVNVTMDAAPGKVRRPTHRAGRLAGLLVRQLFLGRIRLAAPLLHPKPGLAQRLRLRGAGPAAGAAARAVPIVAELVGGAVLLTLLTERLLLWDTLSRSGLPSALLPVLGAALHRNIGSRSAAPIRNRGLHWRTDPGRVGNIPSGQGTFLNRPAPQIAGGIC